MSNFRGVGLAKNDGSSSFEAFDHGRIFVGDELLVELRSVRGAHPLRGHQILDRHRDAVQRPQGVSPHDGGFGLPSRGARSCGRDGAVGVKRGVKPLDTRKHSVHHFYRGNLPGADCFPQLQSRHITQLNRIHGTLP
jgi:hypothetical protein